jgi:O-acetyl-ADP-ribose deacetylase (regulator of RNase III)
MITIVNGDLFTSEAQTIVNTVNCVGAMGKGIALEYKKRYPKMYHEYKSLCDRNLMDVGKLWIFKTPEKWILNFPTKKHWRHQSEVQYLILGLTKFVDTYKVKGITSIAFPLLGASNGGIEPEVSEDLMIQFLKRCEIPVYIYK